MLSKKGQFKIQQMAFMLIGVILFFVLVGLIWISFQTRVLRGSAAQLEKEQAIILSEFVSGSAEFSCTSEMGGYCVDTDKAMALRNMDSYSKFWPVSYIKLRKLDGNPEKECNLNNYPDCNIINAYENKAIDTGGGEIGSFVALCRYEKIEGYSIKICELGKISIGYEIK